MNILMIGASGSGKGTQAKILVEKYGFCHLSMGDVLKEEVKRGTSEGRLIDEYQKNGNLVPLEIVLKALDNKMKSTNNVSGFLLDGFPRNMEQVKALTLDIDLVLNFNNDLEKLYDRLVNRRVCKECNSNFHISQLKDGRCPLCKGEVYQRSDDNEASIAKRMNFYKESVIPVVEHYKSNGYNVVDINADDSIENVSAQIAEAINGLKR